jgi:hypothetical protein
MKRFVVMAVLVLFCIASPTAMQAKDKTSHVDMSHMDHIFVGWVDMNPDSWKLLDYDTKKEWADVIDSLNEYFHEELKTVYLPGKTLTVAKNKDDENAAGNDLYIKFTDVSVDKGYRLHAAIHFIDPKSGAEIAAIPLDSYRGRVCGLVGCMQKSLNKIGEKLNKEIMVAPGK